MYKRQELKSLSGNGKLDATSCNDNVQSSLQNTLRTKKDVFDTDFSLDITSLYKYRNVYSPKLDKVEIGVMTEKKH